MKNIYIFLLIVLGLCFISCGSEPKTEKTEPEAPVEEVQDVEEIQDVTEDISEPEDDVELVNEDITVDESDDEEYHRSIQALSAEEHVTKDEFAEDKAEILRIIKELQKGYIYKDQVIRYSMVMVAQ